MLQSGQTPFLMTDSVFLEGRCNGNQFEKRPAHGDAYKKKANAAGVSTTGKVYLSGLAEEPGDPRAWVSGRGDVRRLLEERGWNSQGAVNHTTERSEPPPAMDIAPDLVTELAEKAVEQDPGLAEKDSQEVRETIKARHKPHWSKK